MWTRIVLPALILYLIWSDSRLSKMVLPTFCGHWFQLSLFHSFGEGIRSLFLLAWHDVAVDIAGCGYAGVSQSCCWSTILSVANWSGKMSVDERTDIEYQGTEPATHLERSIGALLVDGGGGLAVGGK